MPTYTDHTAEVTTTTHPQEGCTRCGCGSKYWDGDFCASCGERYRPAHHTKES